MVAVNTSLTVLLSMRITHKSIAYRIPNLINLQYRSPQYLKTLSQTRLSGRYWRTENKYSVPPLSI